MENSIKHIAIAGNIGAGKTTLSEHLGRQFNWRVMYEDVDDNPYLQDFYENMPRWSFNLQVYFLNSRYNQIRDIQSGNEVIIQDRTIYEDAHIFAPNLYEMKLMSERDFQNYVSLFKTLSSFYRPPDLLIYLRASVSTLMNQIKRRGRDYEGTIRVEYLARLNAYYENWIENYNIGKLLIINVDDINFADNPDHLHSVIEQVHQAINELETQA